MPDSTTVAAVRLIGGAEIVIERLDSLHPNSHQPPTPPPKSHTKQKNGAKPNSANSAAETGSEDPAVVSSIGGGSGSSSPPLYLTGLQVEYRTALNSAVDSNGVSPPVSGIVYPSPIASSATSAQHKPRHAGSVSHTTVADAWTKEKQAGESPPHSLDVAA